MYFPNFPKRKNELINLKPIKKSNYLKNLEKQRYEGLKLIENEKAGILIDKILRRETIYRDYSIFNSHGNINEKFSTVENHKRKNRNFNNYNFNKNNNSQKKYKIYNNNNSKNNKVINKISKETFITRGMDRKNFLSAIGDDIINSNYLVKDKNKSEKK